MKTYKVITQEYMGSTATVIERTDENGSVASIPTDLANSDYAEYLRYTQWVEAGNNPDEFWTQTLEL
jgi:hypothetical protein